MILESDHDTTYAGHCIWNKTIAEAPSMHLAITLSFEDKSLEIIEYFNDENEELVTNPYDSITNKQVNEICGVAYNQKDFPDACIGWSEI